MLPLDSSSLPESRIRSTQSHTSPRSVVSGVFRASVRRAALFAPRAALALLATTLLAAGQPAVPVHTHGCTSASSPEATAVKVTTQRQGGVSRFYVENDEFCEVTMTFEMRLRNLRGEHRFPYTATFPARQVTEAFTLSPVDPTAKWEYNYTNYYKLGSNCARPDDSYLYQLPYGPGCRYKVTQGYNGKFSHFGPNQYAIDWQMPEGTLVHAARGGIVVRVKDDSDRGGSSMEYDRFNNYVLIRHPDGTLGHYCHLQKGGCLVRVGQTVAAGDPIAHSGNTGFSSGAHLHFCVFKTKNGRERVSLPVRFKTADESAITLLAGHTYRAPELQSASAKSAIAAQPVLPLVR